MTKPKAKSKRTYVSVDIEASGPIPGEFSMLAIGACLVPDRTKGFYIELQPLNDNFVPEAMAVCGLDLKGLKTTGVPPDEAMQSFADWLAEEAGEWPAFVAYPVAFDWMFVAWYFHKFLGRNPFGVSGVDIRSLYMGRARVEWEDSRKDQMIEAVRPKRALSHNALQDARDQGELAWKIMQLP